MSSNSGSEIVNLESERYGERSSQSKMTLPQLYYIILVHVHACVTRTRTYVYYTYHNLLASGSCCTILCTVDILINAPIPLEFKYGFHFMRVF